MKAEPSCSPHQLDLRIVLPSQVFGGAERTVLNLLEGMARLPTQPRVTLYGHADMLREAVDGRSGEDPDEDWVPTWLENPSS